ncbi:MAG: NAD(P)/FAD-dependent oxidoreductase [Chitinophagales bacterium]|nr:NAD(P)/FAD-dependent oxidoreductase [Chitinophagales bacterium]
MENRKKLVIVGGGAAGFMAAITLAEAQQNIDIIILEQGNEVLGKVRISGGGRCNVTHACYDVKELVKFYPRGNKELLSPFFQFNCEHTIDFFESKNVTLKTEDDGRIFPTTDDSMTIVNCLKNEATKLGIKIILQAKVMQISIAEKFEINYNNTILKADYLLIASGSNNTIWNSLKSLKHTIIEPVPSLFTFNTKNNLFRELSGISVPNTQIKIKETSIETTGILLITHTGLSGPVILKLSAFGARFLAEKNYQFSILINWINESKDKAINELNAIKIEHSKKAIQNFSPYKLANRFWKNCLLELNIDTDKQWANLNKNELHSIADFLTNCEINIQSKSTNKDEFVTAGGVALNEVDFKTMQSKIVPNLYFAGEVLDIDAVTGGFNFQAAWTTGFIAGNNIGE